MYTERKTESKVVKRSKIKKTNTMMHTLLKIKDRK